MPRFERSLARPEWPRLTVAPCMAMRKEPWRPSLGGFALLVS
jgi:hypothetical protein